jgi:hypothetical protein
VAPALLFDDPPTRGTVPVEPSAAAVLSALVPDASVLEPSTVPLEDPRPLPPAVPAAPDDTLKLSWSETPTSDA